MPRPRRLQPSRDPRRWRSTSGTSAGPPACKLKQLPLRPGRQPRCGARWGCRTSARARQMNATPSPRRSSPSGPDSLAGGPEAVAGNGSSPAGNGSPLAGKRVIDNSNTSGHVPQHARQLFGRPGDGGRSRVFAGRKSGLRYRGYISGHPLPPLISPCTAAPHPWQARGHLPPGPLQDQVGGTPLKSNKCHWSSSRGRHY